MSANAPLEAVEQQQEVDSIVSTDDVEVNGVWYEDVVVRFTESEVQAVQNDESRLSHLITLMETFGFTCLVPTRANEFDGMLPFRRTLDEEYQF